MSSAGRANLAPKARQIGKKILGIERCDLDSQLGPALFRVQESIVKAQMQLSGVLRGFSGGGSDGRRNAHHGPTVQPHRGV